MPSPIHQDIVDKLKELLVTRFRAALEMSGRGGEIDVKTGVEHIFREPERKRARTFGDEYHRHCRQGRHCCGITPQSHENAGPQALVKCDHHSINVQMVLNVH
jgi:hypothetical protein